MAGNWSHDPTKTEYDHPEGCPECQARDEVAEAGARTLVAQTGADYDTLDDHQKAHYKLIASEVMAAMSEALLETGLARVSADE